MENLKDEMNAAAMAGRGGVQAHRIAAQADREYILTREDNNDDVKTDADARPSESAGYPILSRAMLCPACLPVVKTSF